MLPKVVNRQIVVLAAAVAWCRCNLDESEGLRNTFLTEYGGDEEKFYEYW
jgi:hypothetical protein